MKKVVYNTQAREGLKNGVDALANAVKVTLGVKGRNVTIKKEDGSIVVTKDGVTVAKEVYLENPLEDVGAQMVKEVASKTDDLAGDGTTTATVLAQAIVSEGIRNIVAGTNPMSLKRGIDKAVEVVVSQLKLISQDVGDRVEQIATISANNDEVIGKLIGDAFKKVGRNGVITLGESKGVETYVEVVEGMQFDRGYLSPYFVNTNNESVDFEDPFILLMEDKISNMEEIMLVLEAVHQTGRPLLIISDDIKENVITTLAANKIRNNVKVCAIKAPEYQEYRKAVLEDIAILTGGVVISEERGVAITPNILNMLGECERITVTADNTLITGGKGEKVSIEIRKNLISEMLKLSTEGLVKESLELRLAKLTGGVGVIYVGAGSEVELGEKKDRVQDALNATKAAVAEGIVAGGGVALIRAAELATSLLSVSITDNDERIGASIVLKAIESPLKTIMDNAGLESGVILSKVKEGTGNFGYNAKTDKYVDMIEDGIIDPLKVTRTALENSSSVAGMILTTECVLIDLPQPKVDMPIPQPSNKGWM
jgi:chaperonin GroEL